MNQIQLVQVLKSLFPSAMQNKDYEVAVDQSDNATIALWNPALGTAPTADQLTAALNTLLLAQAKAAQMAAVAAASVAAQTSGFSSSALGSAYSYPSGTQDQANLTALVTASMIPGNPSGWTCLFWCTSGAGVSNFVAHTAAQIQKVGQDALTAIMAAKQKQLTLTMEIEAATSVAAVQAIVWS